MRTAPAHEGSVAPAQLWQSIIACRQASWTFHMQRVGNLDVTREPALQLAHLTVSSLAHYR